MFKINSLKDFNYLKITGFIELGERAFYIKFNQFIINYI